MASIEEVPIGEVEEDSTPAAPVAVRKRGRPKGALNKPKEKAAAKKPRVAKPPVSESEEEAPVKKKVKRPPSPQSSEETPVKKKAKKRPPSPQSSEDDEPPTPRKPRRARVPVVSPGPMDTRQVASEVLQLLSNRHVNAATAKREKYRSWFA